jgi:PAS domain S-box-containing protein
MRILPEIKNTLTSGFSKKIITLLFVFGIVPIGILTLIFFTVYFQWQKQGIIRVQSEISERISTSISAYLEKTTGKIQIFASMLCLNPPDKEELRNRAYTLLDREFEYDDIVIADREGNEICKISRYYTYRNFELGKIEDQESLQFARQGKSHISRVEISPFTQFPQVRITVPVIDMGDQVNGVLVAGVNVARMWEMISKYRIGEGRYAYIVDSQGTLIAYRDLSSVLQKKDLTEIQGVQYFLQKKTGVFEYIGLNKKAVIGAITEIPITGWGVIIEDPVSAAYGNLHVLSGVFLSIFIITVVFAVYLGLRFSFENIILPVRRLQKETEIIAKGDFDRRIEMKRTDELGQLAQTFNETVQYLQKTTVSRDLLLQEIEERKRTETALQHRIEFERLITEISSHFISLESEEIDAGINRTLKDIGQFSKVDRSYVFRFSEGGRQVNNTHEWCAKDIEPQIQKLQEIFVEDEFPWASKKLRNLEVIHVPSVSALPPQAARDKSHFEMQGIQSLVIVPMVRGDSAVGFLGFDSVKTEKKWFEESVALLKIVGEIIVSALIRKQAEASLRESEERYRHLVEASPIPILVHCEEKIVFLNAEAVKTLGSTSAHEFIGMSIWDIVHSDSRNIVADRVTNIYEKENGRSVLGEKLIRRDGKTIHVEATASAIDYMGKPASQVVFRDVTDRIHLEAQLQQSRKMEAIGTLAGGIAHDFNNILAGIIGYAELAILNAEPDSKISGYLNKLLKGSERAKNLIQQILSFARKGEQDFSPLPLSSIIKESLNLLRSTLPSTIEIRQNIGGEPGYVMANPVQIQQIVMNLCTNAAHAMREKGGVLEISLTRTGTNPEDMCSHSEAQNESYFKLTVSDTGHGIAPSQLERIFDPYYTTKEKSDGTGLGLAIVHQLVKNHKGELAVESQTGRGSAFHVYLPQTDPEKETASEKIPNHVSEGHECILFVDDEEHIGEVSGELLSYLGYQVTISTGSLEALEIFRSRPHQFDLVITDMTMPNMTGLELSEELMKIRPDIPIILCTGFSELISEENADERGIRAFIMKPVIKEQLAQTIRQVLDN